MISRNESKEAVRTTLKERGLKVSIRDRKLSSGPKLFFTVECPEGNLWQRHNEVTNVIREHFPEASMTSGGPSTRTYAEY